MKNDWIDLAVGEFKAHCVELQEQLKASEPGNLLDSADRIGQKLYGQIAQVQQQAIQHHINSTMSQSRHRYCPDCSEKMRHKGKSSFDFISRFGHLHLAGIYYRCRCGQSKGVSDFVNKGRHFSLAANELAVRYAGSVSFTQAKRYLQKDFGICVSHELLRQNAYNVGRELKQLRDNNSHDCSWSNLAQKRLYGYVDGVLVNIRDEGWKECKLLRYDHGAETHVRYRALLGPVDRFGKMVRREAIALNAQEADEIVMLMDGAQGFHNHISKNLPNARMITDYWHACQHISQCSEVLHPNDPKQKTLWRKRYCYQLRDYGPAKVLKGLRLSQKRRKYEHEREALRLLIGYIGKRKDRMNYPELLRENYRVDSGPIESACKNVVQARMKLPGMRWSRPGARAMLEVRTALCSDIWEKLIEHAA
jgi:hypothetical protein